MLAKAAANHDMMYREPTVSPINNNYSPVVGHPIIHPHLPYEIDLPL